uniref:Major facilitator superfamily (MFS) profile domain-containing protein n=2 Tax=Clytia hemisphaerica TaxID=252671 RepID=A0A7M5WS77_9CNID
FGRRPTTCGNWVISGVSCMGVAFIPTHGVYNWIRVAFGMLGKLSVTLAFSALFVWSVELYPTVIRSQGMGLMNVVSRIGGAYAPWVAQYVGNFNKYLPFLVMGSLSLISAALCYKLNETTGMALAETLEDFNQSDSKESKTMTTIIENDFTKEDEKDQKENTSV